MLLGLLAGLLTLFVFPPVAMFVGILLFLRHPDFAVAFLLAGAIAAVPTVAHFLDLRGFHNGHGEVVSALPMIAVLVAFVASGKVSGDLKLLAWAMLGGYAVMLLFPYFVASGHYVGSMI